MTDFNIDVAMFKLIKYGDNELLKLTINHLKTAPELTVKTFGGVICKEADVEIFEYFLESISYQPDYLDHFLEDVVITYLQVYDEVENNPDELLQRAKRLIEFGANINYLGENNNHHGLMREELQTMRGLGYNQIDPLVDTLDESVNVIMEEIHQLLDAGVCKHRIINQLGLS